MGGTEIKEEGVETEDGAGNPTGNTPIPHSTGVGVSTRRTTYVMVSEGIQVVNNISVNIPLMLLNFVLLFLILLGSAIY